MGESKSVTETLRRPFKAEEVGKLPRVICPKCSDRNQRCDEHRKTKCGECQAYVSERHIHIDYVGHADVTSRLLEADPEWNWEPVATDERGLPVFDLDDRGSPVGLWIKLTVGGMTRLGYGSVPSGQNDAVKVLIGDCLTRGTPVRTDRGILPIESVCVGDQVPTREGWRRVTDHWLSHPAAPTKAVLLADGRVVVGTPHHRIPTANRGLQRIEALRNGDMLYAWQATAETQAQTRSSGTGDATGASQIIPTGIVACTSWQPPRRATTSMSTSTKRRTAQSPKAGTSITATLTRLTMSRAISSPSRQKITPSGTVSIWSPTSGAAMSAASRMRPSADGAAGVLLLARNAGGAETGLPTFTPARDLSASPAPARNADPSSSPSDPGHASALVPVVAVLDGGPGEVWNLSVEGVHEYVANGIVVQNSLRNAAMRFGVALALWAKGDRADPAAENATASAGQARRGRQPAGESFENAAPAPPRQRTEGNGHAASGEAVRPAQAPRPAAVQPGGEADPEAQPYADEAHEARVTETVKDIHNRARDAHKLAALIRNPATGGVGGLGQYLNHRRGVLQKAEQALAALLAAGTAAGIDAAGIETRLKDSCGHDLEEASAEEMAHATELILKEAGAAA